MKAITDFARSPNGALTFLAPGTNGAPHLDRLEPDGALIAAERPDLGRRDLLDFKEAGRPHRLGLVGRVEP